MQGIISDIPSPELYFLINEEKIDLTKNGPESIKSQSRVVKYQFNNDHPSWSKVSIGANTLRDSDTITEVEYEYFSLSPSEYIQSSAYTNYPEYYKFHSLEFILNEHTLVTTRYSYGFLEFLRDVGGLCAALIILFKFFCPFFGNVKLMSILARKAYYSPGNGEFDRDNEDSRNN